MRMEMFSVAPATSKAFDLPAQTHRVGHQTFTIGNLCVPSYHNEIPYYTTRWDALCPYIAVSEEMIACAKRPLIVYALPPDSPYGVPINDKYGLVDLRSQTLWEDPRRSRKFSELSKRFKQFRLEKIGRAHV